MDFEMERFSWISQVSPMQSRKSFRSGSQNQREGSVRWALLASADFEDGGKEEGGQPLENWERQGLSSETFRRGHSPADNDAGVLVHEAEE